jgi:hypothetical protein
MRNAATVQRWTSAGFRGLVRADWAGEFAEIDPLDWVQRASVQLVRDRPSSRVHRCTTPRGVVYAKIISAVSDAAPTDRPLDPLKWALRRSRSIAAMRVSRRMDKAGIRCAPIVLAARKPGRTDAIEVMVSLEVPGRGLLTILRSDAPVQVKLDLTRQAAQAIERLHSKGFMHGDLHPNNMIPAGEPAEMWFIDNDRTRAWFIPLPWVFRKRNLSQMGYRLARESPALLEAFLDEYLNCARVGRKRAEQIRRGVQSHVNARLEWRANRRNARETEES